MKAHPAIPIDEGADSEKVRTGGGRRNYSSTMMIRARPVMMTTMRRAMSTAPQVRLHTSLG